MNHVEPLPLAETAPFPYRDVPRVAPPARAAPTPATGRELVALGGLLLASELLLWPAGLGVGAAVFFLLAPAVLWFASVRTTRSPRLGAIAALITLLALRMAWQPSYATFALGLSLVFAFAFAREERRAFVTELLVSLVVSSALALPLVGTFAESLRSRVAPAQTPRRPWREVLVPVVLAGAFGLVFSAANPLVWRWVSRSLERAFSIRVLPSFGHIAFWGACTVGALALLRPSRPARDEVTEAAEDAPDASHVATARNVLIALNALFFAYNALDLVYLWGGRLPPGVGHTQYAHQGTFWLTVALAMSTAVLGWIFASIHRPHPVGHLRTLAYAWAAQNLVLGAGTFLRIWKYVDFSGLTTLRLVGVTGSALVVAGLALIVWKVHHDRSFLWLLRKDLDALMVAAVLFAALPTDAWVSRFNSDRILRGQGRPMLHLIQQDLSAESVPGMLPLLAHPDPVVRTGTAAKLLRLRDRLRREAAAAPHWTAWSASQSRALRLLDVADDALRPLDENNDRLRAADTDFAQAAWRSNDR